MSVRHVALALLSLSFTAPLAAAGCSGGDPGAVANPQATAACKAACDQFVGGKCYGECTAVCATPSCVTDPTGFQDVISVVCTDTFNFQTASGTTACSSPDMAAPGPDGVGTQKRIFVTETAFGGNLRAQGGGATGLQGADNLCNQAAEAASLGGVWVAWLSTSTVDAIDRVEDVGPWLNVSRTAILFPNKASLTQTPQAWSNVETEKGRGRGTGYVWTGTRNGGRLASDATLGIETCSDWTDDSSDLGLGHTGSVNSSGSAWTDASDDYCFRGLYPIFCIEQ